MPSDSRVTGCSTSSITAALIIGERWRVGADVVLEVSCPHTPCGTFQGWLRRNGWIKEFTQAALPGAYLRVVTPARSPPVTRSPSWTAPTTT